MCQGLADMHYLALCWVKMRLPGVIVSSGLPTSLYILVLSANRCIMDDTTSGMSFI